MLKIAGGILMLGILVFVHELGHFLVAKCCRVKVLKFSLGFGPKLFSRTWGETEYKICLIPLGGYVQMLGEGAEDDQQPVTEEDRSRSFAEKPVLQRLAIVAAGPAMNLALPFLFLPLAYFLGMDQPKFLDRPACVGYVVGESFAARAGFQASDCIFQVDGTETVSWAETEKQLLSHAGREMSLLIKRDAEILELLLPPEAPVAEGMQGIGLMPQQSAVIGFLDPGTPAALAGLQPGDRIVAIDGTEVMSWYDIHTLVQAGEGRALSVTVMRAGRQSILNITPELKGENEAGQPRYIIGVGPQVEAEFKRYAFADAVGEGFARGAELVDLTLLFLRKLFAGHISAQNIGGPIMVVQMAGAVAEEVDVAKILSMLAFLSVQLGILNLLPVPILDGGHLLFGLVELVRRKPLSEQAREVAQQIGLAMIVLLMAWAFYNDIMRILRLQFGG
ncbi:RIP metalloprotease RseP [Syntrophotalea acetylenica]|uniref:RIP metalloprotease RseP n=1 Tax=Syntrophotalea acetylenica TaxID=29542 RepID=UPI002A36733A|nr:RIP metalloprotease RseP [Syntrophotalea acetylenica]MDY0261220.1 RIP metalloprotease RseP [Syntrophotalea acetylenica]